jgi:hypothetical protein
MAEARVSSGAEFIESARQVSGSEAGLLRGREPREKKHGAAMLAALLHQT